MMTIWMWQTSVLKGRGSLDNAAGSSDVQEGDVLRDRGRQPLIMMQGMVMGSRDLGNQGRGPYSLAEMLSVVEFKCRYSHRDDLSLCIMISHVGKGLVLNKGYE